MGAVKTQNATQSLRTVFTTSPVPQETELNISRRLEQILAERERRDPTPQDVVTREEEDYYVAPIPDEDEKRKARPYNPFDGELIKGQLESNFEDLWTEIKKIRTQGEISIAEIPFSVIKF